jgi:hypothetical protein
MEQETTCEGKDPTFSQYLYMAMELSDTEWKLGFTIGFGQAPRLRDVAAGNLAGLVKEIRLAKERFSLSENTVVLSCYVAPLLAGAGCHKLGGGFGQH